MIENCRLNREKLSRLGMSKDEMCILEGLLFPYSDFGGADLLRKEPMDLIRELEANNQIEDFFFALSSEKKYENNKIIDYVNESEIISLLKLDEYYPSLAPVFNKFNMYHDYAEEYKEYKALTLELKVSIVSDLKVYFKTIDIDPENKLPILHLIKDYLDKLEFSDYYNIKEVFKSKDMEKLIYYATS